MNEWKSKYEETKKQLDEQAQKLARTKSNRRVTFNDEPEKKEEVTLQSKDIEMRKWKEDYQQAEVSDTQPACLFGMIYASEPSFLLTLSRMLK